MLTSEPRKRAHFNSIVRREQSEQRTNTIKRRERSERRMKFMNERNKEKIPWEGEFTLRSDP